MRSTNFLAKVFDQLGEVFERANPAAFRFLAAVLPYITPFPVAWLTSKSASKFLNFSPNVSFIFVFALEGIGLWFTSLLVDSVVEWIRSKNIKTFTIVLLFGFVVIAYVTILVNLNVTLESSLENPSPALSRVITLLCFLPFLSGIGNGYYKLRLEYKSEMEQARAYKLELEEKIRQEARQDKMERFKIKHGISRTSETTYETDMKVPKEFRNTNETSKNTSGIMGRPSIHQERVFEFMEQYYKKNGAVASFSEVMKVLNLPQSTTSRLRDKWIESQKND